MKRVSTESICRNLISEGSVLLKNENNTLPLKQNEKVAFIGPYCDVNELMTRWSMVTHHRDKGISIKQALYNKFGEGKYPCEKASPFSAAMQRCATAFL